VVENSPEMEGGYDGMINFISKELKYPAKARMDGKQGTVFVQFIVEKDGSVSNVSIARGVEASLDAEAMRVVQLTKWKPGKQKGEVVRVRFVLPIKYKL
jgi:protein TonB